MCGPCLHDNQNPDAEILHNHLDYTRNQKDFEVKNDSKNMFNKLNLQFLPPGRRQGGGGHLFVVSFGSHFNRNHEFTKTKEKYEASVHSLWKCKQDLQEVMVGSGRELSLPRKK